MTIKFILIFIFTLAGVIIGYWMLSYSDRIVAKKCAKKNLEEQLNAFNILIKKKQTKVGISVTNGIVWALIGYFESNTILAILISLIITLGIVISIIDIRIRIIPNELVLTLILAGIVYQLIGFGAKSLFIGFCCMIVIMALFMILGAVMGLEKIGAGDVKLAGAMALVLGFPNIFTGMLFMALVILGYCFIGFSLYKLSLKSMFAYAPFMMSGMVIAMIVMLLDINIFAGTYL